MSWKDDYEIMVKFKQAQEGLLKRKDLTDTEHNAIEMGIELYKKEVARLDSENKLYWKRNGGK